MSHILTVTIKNMASHYRSTIICGRGTHGHLFPSFLSANHHHSEWFDTDSFILDTQCTQCYIQSLTISFQFIMPWNLSLSIFIQMLPISNGSPFNGSKGRMLQHEQWTGTCTVRCCRSSGAISWP